MKKILAILLCLSMLLCFMPTAAFAAEEGGQTPTSSGGEGEAGGQGETAYAAQIGERQYTTLDEAIAVAADGATIKLLADCKTAGMNLSKNLTIDGSKSTGEQTVAEGGEEEQTPSEQKGWTVTFNNKGIALHDKSLTFKNCDVVMNGIGSTVELNWTAVCAGNGASLNLENATMTMNGTGAGDAHAIYFCSDNKLNLNNSKLEIKNYAQDALEWDGGDGGYNVNLTNSTYISDHNRSGFTGTFYATFDNSVVKVLNSAGNGSNGTYYTIKNNSNVTFDGNGNWGISAWRIDMTDNSTLNATNNGYSGVWTRVLNVDETCTLNVEKNGSKAPSSATNGGIVFFGNKDYTSTIEKGANVTIKDNAGPGIYTKQAVCNLTIGSATITNNGTGSVNKDEIGAEKGGGVYNVGTLILDDSVVLYNNHAATAGDDIYCDENAQITFGVVGTDWILDDCNDKIDGWYDDSEEERWKAHQKPVHCEEYTAFKNGGAISGLLALKAAHALKPLKPGETEVVDGISKSKVALADLDSNYETNITLSLPAKDTPLVSDVVFVLDKSTSDQNEEKILSMLTELNNQVKATSAKVNVGIIIFNKIANVELELTELNDQSLSAIEAAIKTKRESGTNIHAGLVAGKQMLEAGTAKAERKYLVLVSDGITYLFCDGKDYKNALTRSFGSAGGGGAYELIQYQWRNGDNGDQCYETYKTRGNGNYIPKGSLADFDWSEYFTYLGQQENTLDPSLDVAYVSPVGAMLTKSTQTSNVEKALYLSNKLYQDLKNQYKVYAVGAAEVNAEHPWGSSFMNYLAAGKTIDFTQIQNDIQYLIGAGSKIEDVMGNVDGYNFDFINNIARLKLTVGGKELEKTALNSNDENLTKYGFGREIEINDKNETKKTYQYVLIYDKAADKFDLEINVNVSQFEPVELTYGVKLMNPSSAAGTHGDYDPDGSENYKGLQTNNSAILYPVDSNGQVGVPEEFAKPTVSYTVGGGSYNPPTTTDGTVKVVKTVSGVTIPAGYRVDVTFTGAAGAKTISLTNFAGNSGTGFLSLKPGTYTYTETATDIDGYQYTVQQGTVTVEAGKTAEILLSNAYTKDAEEPTTPDKPDKPTKPEQPTKPDQPTKPEDKTEVPKTGDNSALAGSAMLLLLSACGLAAALRRKEEK